MNGCPICYHISKGAGARPLRISLGRIAVRELDAAAAALFAGAEDASEIARCAAHAARHLLTFRPARYAKVLAEVY